MEIIYIQFMFTSQLILFPDGSLFYWNNEGSSTKDFNKIRDRFYFIEKLGLIYSHWIVSKITFSMMTLGGACWGPFSWTLLNRGNRRNRESPKMRWVESPCSSWTGLSRRCLDYNRSYKDRRWTTVTTAHHLTEREGERYAKGKCKFMQVQTKRPLSKQ